MAVEPDTENQRLINEQTPLLPEQQQTEQASDIDPEDDEELKRTSHTSWYLWRIFWFVVAALVLAVFIKGWVDAGGDVDVCFDPSLIGLQS